MKRKKEGTRISSMELKSLGVAPGAAPAGGSSKKKKDRKAKEPASQPAGQSKISDFVSGGTRDPKAGRVDVSFDGRLEQFTTDELKLVGAVLTAKTKLSGNQLAMLVELWNTHNVDVFKFLAGENEGRPVQLAELQEPLPSGTEHIYFRERTQNTAPVIHFGDIKITTQGTMSKKKY